MITTDRHAVIGSSTFVFGRRTYIMGVVNTSADSFSGDGMVDEDAAAERALRLIEEGAGIVDIGGQSTRPGSVQVDAEEEAARVVPVITAIRDQCPVPISVDTYKPEVARRALEVGADMVNDISGLSWGTEVASLCVRYNAVLVLTHIKGTPKTMQRDPTYDDVISEIKEYFVRQVQTAEHEGLERERIIVDPGIGFGKTVEHNLEILRRLGEFCELGFPILVGPSRKSFIGAVLDLPPEERLEGTAAAVAFAVVQGADIVRVHDVKQMSQVTRMTDALCGRGQEVGVT